MIPDFTKAQLDDLVVSRDRPLIICDVDEVVVHFTQHFEDYLARRQLSLHPESLALHGNIRHTSSGRPVADDEVSDLIDSFFAEETAHLKPIEGSVESLLQLGQTADVVFLTNLPHHAREKRITNLRDIGLPYPVITNSGPKGPAITNLASRTSEAVVFVDDSPYFIASSKQHAPDVHLVHFVQDHRFGAFMEHFEFVSLRTNHWAQAKTHIAALIS